MPTCSPRSDQAGPDVRTAQTSIEMFPSSGIGERANKISTSPDFNKSEGAILSFCPSDSLAVSHAFDCSATQQTPFGIQQQKPIAFHGWRLPGVNAEADAGVAASWQ